MFGFNVNFGGMNGQLEVFDCMMDIYVNGNEQRQRLQAPRMIIEQQFLGVCQEIANMDVSAKVKLSRIAKCHNMFDNKWIEHEIYIDYKNNAYVEEENEK